MQDTDAVSIGYIKVKFDIDPERPGLQRKVDAWTDLFETTRRTNYCIYVALGHESIRDNEHGRDIIRQATALGGKITRLDFSVDLCNDFDFITYYRCLCCRHRHQTMQDKIGLPQLYTSPAGDTVYVGKRSSARFFRVYDKTAEIRAKKKLDIGFALTRYELECKRSAVAVYLPLFMQGRLSEIASDMAARYHLPEIAESQNRILPTESGQAKNSVWDFVARYRRILKLAWLEDKDAYLDIIGVH
jgi:hypothetical protein